MYIAGETLNTIVKIACYPVELEVAKTTAVLISLTKKRKEFRTSSQGS